MCGLELCSVDSSNLSYFSSFVLSLGAWMLPVHPKHTVQPEIWESLCIEFKALPVFFLEFFLRFPVAVAYIYFVFRLYSLERLQVSANKYQSWYITSLKLSFLMCKMEIIIVSVLQVCYRDYRIYYNHKRDSARRPEHTKSYTILSQFDLKL